MSTALQVNNLDIIEQLVVDGDISKLTQEQRLRYYYATCERLGLDPMSQPLGYLKLNGKTVLYAYKGATDQIAGKRSISRRIVKTDILNNKVYLVVAEASDASGRVEQSTGAISIENLGGENLVNALLKAETKAKRRAVLSFTGAGMLDETEADSIPGAVFVREEQPRQIAQTNNHAAPATVAQLATVEYNRTAKSLWFGKKPTVTLPTTSLEAQAEITTFERFVAGTPLPRADESATDAMADLLSGIAVTLPEDRQEATAAMLVAVNSRQSAWAAYRRLTVGSVDAMEMDEADNPL